MKRFFIVLLIMIIFPVASCSADAWVSLNTISGQQIYVDPYSLQYDQNEDIVKVSTMTMDANGYTIVLERFSLSNKTLIMDAMLTYTVDGKLKEWKVIKHDQTLWERIFGESFEKINPTADGMVVLAYVKAVKSRGAIHY